MHSKVCFEDDLPFVGRRKEGAKSSQPGRQSSSIIIRIGAGSAGTTPNADRKRDRLYAARLMEQKGMNSPCRESRLRTIIQTPCSPPRMRSPRPFHRLNLVRVVRSPSSRTLCAPQEMTRRSKEESTPRGFRHLGQDQYHATRPHDRDWADGRTIVNGRP